MFPALVLIVLGATGALAVLGVVATVRNQPPGRALLLVTKIVVGLLVLQAAIGAFRVFTGVVLPETSTFLIYLVVSVCVLPIASQYANAEPTRWGGAVIAVAAIGTAVAVVRLNGLWAAAGV